MFRCLLHLMGFLCFFVWITSHKAFELSTDEYDCTTFVSLENGNDYVQNFTAKEGLLKGISIRFGTFKQLNH